MKSCSIFISGILCWGMMAFVAASQAFGQQTDTARTEQELELRQRRVLQPYHSERNTSNFILSESGTYDVPTPTTYYTPPFKEQENLDKAVAAYREKLFQTRFPAVYNAMRILAPFVNNQFQFGVYRINDTPMVDGDHPLLRPQLEQYQQQ